MTQAYVLAQLGNQQHLACGGFGRLKVGDTFPRDPLFGGGEWKVIKVFNYDEQRVLEALEALIGTERLSQLFKV
jgi:hypothetical protein